MNDINCSNTVTFTNTIGNSDFCFAGHFDGNGKTISNFELNSAIYGSGDQYQGIFGCINGGTVINLNLRNFVVNIVLSDVYIGSVCGYLENGTISGCTASTGTFTSYSFSTYVIGGLIGSAFNLSTITNCYTSSILILSDHNYNGGLIGDVQTNVVISNCNSSANVSGINYIGGFAGEIYGNITLSNSYSTGIVSGRQIVGGFAGQMYDKITISNCHSTGIVSGGQVVGGFCGYLQKRSFSNCYSTANSSASCSYCGGFVGFITSNDQTDITNFYQCYSSGSITLLDVNTSYMEFEGGIGGFCGSIDNFNDAQITFNKCYSLSDIYIDNTYPYYMNTYGGFIGAAIKANVINCYCRGNLIGPGLSTSSECGGFVGITNRVSSFTNCYSSSIVSGGSAVSGFCGYDSDYEYDPPTNYACCFWNTQTSGYSYPLGNSSTITLSGIQGKTTAQMQQQTTFSCFDFNNVWSISASAYPELIMSADVLVPDLTYCARITIILSLLSVGVYLVYKKYIV